MAYICTQTKTYVLPEMFLRVMACRWANNVAVGCLMRAVASKSHQRARRCTDSQRELKVVVYIIRQLQGADRILRADVHPGQLCWRGSKTALRGLRYSWLAINSCNMKRAQRHYSYI